MFASSTKRAETRGCGFILAQPLVSFRKFLYDLFGWGPRRKVQKKRKAQAALQERLLPPPSPYVKRVAKVAKPHAKTRIKNKPSCLGAVEEPKPKGLYVIIPAGNVITKNQPTA